MSNLIKHAKREFEVLGWTGDDEIQKLICDQVLELLVLFGKHGHSGSSALYAVGMFKKLVMFEPISPLTGEDSEWNEVGSGVFQNNRSSNIFKGDDGKAYNIDGRVFREKDGTCYTSIESRVYVEFPYTPKTEYVDV